MTEEIHLHDYADLALLRRLMATARPLWRRLAVISATTLLIVPVALLLPIPLKIVVDSVIGDVPLSSPLGILPTQMDSGTLLALSALLLISITVLHEGLVLASWLLRTWAGERLVVLFRAELFRHVQRMSLAFHDRQGAADLTFRIQYDAQAIQHVLVDGLIPLMGSLLTVAGMVYVTALIDGHLALVALAVAPIMYVLARHSRQALRRRWERVYELRSGAMSVVQEVLGGMRVVKAFGQEDREEGRFQERSGEAVRGHLDAVTAEGKVKLLVAVTAGVGMAAVLIIGTVGVEAGTLTLGELLIVTSYIAMLYEPLRDASGKVADLQSSLSAAERAYRLLDTQPDVADRVDARPMRRATGAFRLDHVTFGYEPGQPVLRDVSMRVRPGTWLGISGPTGAGKTTLVSLIARFNDPDEGSVWLDGVDLRDLRLADLRRQFGMVLQEPVLFPASISENIAYARPDASREEIAAAARAAGADEFIRSLPEGFDTLVGERGQRLSGGERQRISIARAFLRDAPILILDEPTSSVDIATEGRIMEAMWRLMEGRTCFLIAHRLSTLERCHRVIHVSGGRVEEAPPAQLGLQELVTA